MSEQSCDGVMQIFWKWWRIDCRWPVMPGVVRRPARQLPCTEQPLVTVTPIMLETRPRHVIMGSAIEGKIQNCGCAIVDLLHKTSKSTKILFSSKTLTSLWTKPFHEDYRRIKIVGFTNDFEAELIWGIIFVSLQEGLEKILLYLAH